MHINTAVSFLFSSFCCIPQRELCYLRQSKKPCFGTSFTLFVWQHEQHEQGKVNDYNSNWVLLSEEAWRGFSQRRIKLKSPTKITAFEVWSMHLNLSLRFQFEFRLKNIVHLSTSYVDNIITQHVSKKNYVTLVFKQKQKHSSFAGKLCFFWWLPRQMFLFTKSIT